jgi:AraC family transcriptional regulator
MFIQQFPNIEWLKAKIREGFSDKKALNDLPLRHVGWPSVVLNARVKTTERKDIKGPFSFFTNLSGHSVIGIEGKGHQINEQCYTLSNQGQHYDLLIDEKDETETLNIHFGEHFFSKATEALISTDKELLDNPFEYSSGALNIRSNSVLKTPELAYSLNKLMVFYKSDESEQREEELLFDILKKLLITNSKEIESTSKLPIQSKTTRAEIMNRLYIARDFIHSYFFKDISLDELSQVSCLSKFHFLRLFKKAFGLSPYQYQKKLRINRALALYQQGHTLEFITSQVGIENASSLSRMIRKQYGAYPSQIVQ